MDPPPRLRHYPEWWLLKLALAVLQKGDMASASARMRRMAHWLRPVLAREWAWAQANLRLVYGSAPSEATLTRLASLAFENMFLSHLEGIRVTDVLVRDVHMERMREVWSPARGLILCSVHLGSWEPMLRRLRELGYPVAAVYRHANNPLSEKVFMDCRQAYGITWIRRADSRGILQALRQGMALALMVDINTVQGGVLAPFLGLPAMCPAGPVRLAMQFQVPLVAGVNVRVGPGETALHCLEVWPPPPKNHHMTVIRDWTQQLNDLFTPWIHQYAEQYNWLHGRWKSRPDGPPRQPGQLHELALQRVGPVPVLSARILEILGENPGG